MVDPMAFGKKRIEQLGPGMEVSSILEKCTTALRNHYRSRLVGVVLYGSEARQEADSASDIDLLVLLQGPFDQLSELRTIVKLLYPIQLESARLISAKPVPIEDFQHQTLSLYRQAHREGKWL